MPHGFLIRCDPASGFFEAEIGDDGSRADAEGCSAVTAGVLDPQDVLRRVLDGETLTAPDTPAAAAVWDNRERSLKLVRDCTGRYPLFETRIGLATAASPDARSLLALPEVSAGQDPLALAAWIAGVSAPPERTLYESLRRVPAGFMLERTSRGQRMVRLWEPAAEGTSNPSEAARFGEVLEAAVARVVDRRCAVFLSGGIDSSAVAAAAAAVAPAAGIAPPIGLCVDIEGASEEREQRLVAGALGLERRSASAAAGGDLAARSLERIAEALWPAGSPWQPVYEDLASAARDSGVRAILDGIGGDELLDAGLRPARNALSRLKLGTLRNLAAAERGYVGGGMRSVLRAAIARSRPWPPPAYLAPRYRADVAELAAAPPDDLLSTRLAAGWEEMWDIGRRQGLVYDHPLWSSEVVTLIRGLPLEALVAGGQAKSPARAYLAQRIPAVAGPWPRPRVADSLLVKLEREMRTCGSFDGCLPRLRELGIVSGDVQLEHVPALLLLCEHWLRSKT